MLPVFFRTCVHTRLLLLKRDWEIKCMVVSWRRGIWYSCNAQFYYYSTHTFYSIHASPWTQVFTLLSFSFYFLLNLMTIVLVEKYTRNRWKEKKVRVLYVWLGGKRKKSWQIVYLTWWFTFKNWNPSTSSWHLSPVSFHFQLTHEFKDDIK